MLGTLSRHSLIAETDATLIRAALKRAARLLPLAAVTMLILLMPLRAATVGRTSAWSGHGLVPEAQPWLRSAAVPYGAPPTVGQYETLELVFDVAEESADPFDTYLLKVAVRDPGGVVTEAEGFYDGDGQGGQSGTIWKVRLCPDSVGQWEWWTVTADAPAPSIASLTGTFDVVDSEHVGGVVADGQHLRFQNGEPVYLVGNFLDLRDGLESTHVYMSEVLTDEHRAAILLEQVTFHQSNKVNIYFANRGDYSWRSVTPWLGTAADSDRTSMDLARWRHYDSYLHDWREAGLLTELWFFADDSGFGGLTDAELERLVRYGMARTSAFSATIYVLALEWGEGFSQERISALGQFAAVHNPWGRLLSVHNHTDWAFSGEEWAGFVCTQVGNSAHPDEANRVAREFRENEPIPHIDEEYGFLRVDQDARLRANNWANLCGGAAGGGTGSGLANMIAFLSTSRMPWQRMAPDNDLLANGGENRYCLAEVGHHYLVYTRYGELEVTLEGEGLEYRWFNPRTGEWASDATAAQPGMFDLSPPTDTDSDWVLWVTDGTNLNSGRTHVQQGADLVAHQQVRAVGGQFIVDLDVRNDGPAMAVGVCFTGTLPACLSAPTAFASGPEIVAREGHDNAWCLVEPLSPNSQVDIRIQGPCSATEHLSSSAHVWWRGPDPDESNNRVTSMVYPSPYEGYLYVPHIAGR